MKRKVLAVDDKEGITKITKELLECLGLEVETANSFSDCLDKIKTNKPDLILLDICGLGIPKEDVIKTVKEHYEGKIILSSGLQKEILIHLAEYNKVYYLTKPYTLQELLVVLQEVFVDFEAPELVRNYIKRNSQINSII